MDYLKMIFVKLLEKQMFFTRFCFLFIIFVLMYYTSFWFNILFQIGSINIHFYLLSVIIVVLFLLIEFLEYFYKRHDNEFYHFLFWLFGVIGIGSLFLACMKFGFSRIEMLDDYVMKNTIFTIKMQYSYNYKLEFLQRYLEYSLYQNNIKDEKYGMITKIIIETAKNKGFDFLLNNPDLTLQNIKEYLFIFIDYAATIYVSQDLYLSFGEKFILYNSLFYAIMSFLRNVIILFTIYKFTLHILPSYILSTFFSNKAYVIAHTVLTNAPGVHFQMTPLEFHDLCQVMAILIVKYYSPLEILLINLNDL